MLVHPDLNRVEHIMHGEKQHQNTTTHGITISMLWIMKGSDSTSTFNRRGKNRISPDSGRDAARKEWGGSWRLPTKEEMEELIDRCKWIWGNINGQNGFWVIGPNQNKIFLPASGCIDGMERHIYNRHGLYQTSTLYYQQYECTLYFISESRSIGNLNRCAGVPIRPVTY